MMHLYTGDSVKQLALINAYCGGGVDACKYLKSLVPSAAPGQLVLGQSPRANATAISTILQMWHMLPTFKVYPLWYIPFGITPSGYKELPLIGRSVALIMRCSHAAYGSWL